MAQSEKLPGSLDRAATARCARPGSARAPHGPARPAPSLMTARDGGRKSSVATGEKPTFGCVPAKIKYTPQSALTIRESCVPGVGFTMTLHWQRSLCYCGIIIHAIAESQLDTPLYTGEKLM